jgi:hypothetical protein
MQKTTCEKFQTKNLRKITPTKYGAEEMKDEMGGACGTNGEKEKCKQCFGEERRIEISLETWVIIKLILNK